MKRHLLYALFLGMPVFLLGMEKNTIHISVSDYETPILQANELGAYVRKNIHVDPKIIAICAHYHMASNKRGRKRKSYDSCEGCGGIDIKETTDLHAVKLEELDRLIPYPLRSLQWSPDGKLQCIHDSVILYRDRDTGSLIGTEDIDITKPNSPTLTQKLILTIKSSNGSYHAHSAYPRVLGSGKWDKEFSVIILEQLACNKRLMLTGHTKRVSKLIFSKDADSKNLISSSHDATIKIWECLTGKCLLTVTAGASVHDIDINQNGSLIASIGIDGNIVDLWETKTGTHLYSLESKLIIPWEYTERIQSVLFDDYEGTTLITGSHDSAIKRWDLKPIINPSWYVYEELKPTAAHFSPNQHLLQASLDLLTNIYEAIENKTQYTITTLIEFQVYMMWPKHIQKLFASIIYCDPMLFYYTIPTSDQK